MSDQPRGDTCWREAELNQLRWRTGRGALLVAWLAPKPLKILGFHLPVIEADGRRGTRLYRPDDSESYDPPVEGEEKPTATNEPTAEDRLEECMASWDEKTHITKSSWRLICQRQIKDNE